MNIKIIYCLFVGHRWIDDMWDDGKIHTECCRCRKLED